MQLKQLYTLVLLLCCVTHGVHSAQKPIVVVIPSYNNQAYCKKNLESVYAQQYDNYHVMYIDDCSSDQTYAMVTKSIKDHNFESKFTLLHNDTRKGALENLYNAIHACPDDAIIVTLDGDDWLPHPNVLQRLNQEYANPDVWMTYGQFECWPSGAAGYNKDIPETAIATRQLRHSCWLATHLRTFYAGLFKQIKREDLLYQGQFYPATWDKAMMAPMMEMADGRWKHLQDVLYIYNQNNPISDFRINGEFSAKLEHVIVNSQPYKPLKELPFITQQHPQQADMVIYSFDRPLQLYALLESMEQYMTGISSIQVIYRASDQSFNHGYQVVKQKFANVVYHQQGAKPQADFKPLTEQAVFSGPSPYVIFAVDDIIVKDYVHLGRCADLMEKYQAYGFYLRLGKNLSECYSMRAGQQVPPCNEVEPGVVAWQFSQGMHDWQYPNNVDMTLYRKQDIKRDIQALHFVAPNSFEGAWAGRWGMIMHKVGLCFNCTKIVNLPLNLVQHESNNRNMQFMSPQQLQDVFNRGMKIDINALYRVSNKAAHTEYAPTFIER